MTFPLNINIVLSTQPTYCNSDINGAEVHFPTKFLNRYFTSVFIQVAPDFAGIFYRVFNEFPVISFYTPAAFIDFGVFRYVPFGPYLLDFLFLFFPYGPLPFIGIISFRFYM